MATYLPPTENLAIFDPIAFNTGNELLTYADAETKLLKYPTAQGAQTFQNTTVNGTLNVSGISTLGEEGIIQTDNSLSALPSFTIKDTVSTQNFLFNPNTVNNTYNGIVEAGDAVITTSNNNQGLVLTNTSSTTTNGVRISTTKTVLGNGGGGVDIPTNNITFDSTATYPIQFTTTTNAGFNRGIQIGTAGLGSRINSSGIQGRLFADFSGTNSFSFVSNVGSNTNIWVTPNVALGASSIQTYNGGSILNSMNTLVGISSTEASIRTAVNGTGTLIPVGFYCNNIKAISLATTGGLITFETPVTANQNISLATSRKLKYPTGNVGETLVSDGTGLLTLQHPTLSVINGTLPTIGSAFPITVSTWVQYASISLTAGTWLVSGRIGLTHTSGTTTIFETATGLSTVNSGVPTTYILNQQIEQTNLAPLPKPIRFTEIQTVITVASTTTYYLMVYMYYGVFTIGLTVSTLAEGGQQLTATRIG